MKTALEEKMKEIRISAGSKTRIIHRQHSSLSTTYTFLARPEIHDSYLAGIVEIKGSSWIFSKPPKKISLQAENSVTAGMWDTFFSVYVTPEIDVVISLPSKSFDLRSWLVVLLILVIAIAIAVIIITSG